MADDLDQFFLLIQRYWKNFKKTTFTLCIDDRSEAGKLMDKNSHTNTYIAVTDTC